jgi:hypothetical protein
VPIAKFAAFRGTPFANFGIEVDPKHIDLVWFGEFRISDPNGDILASNDPKLRSSGLKLRRHFGEMAITF